MGRVWSPGHTKTPQSGPNVRSSWAAGLFSFGTTIAYMQSRFVRSARGRPLRNAQDMEPFTPEEAALFEAFRVLRERVFVGSDAFREGVIHRVRQAVEGHPAEPLGITLAVHALNFLASLFSSTPDHPGTSRPPGTRSSDEENDSAAPDDSKDPK